MPDYSSGSLRCRSTGSSHSGSDNSDKSYHSSSTAPTEYTSPSSPRPPFAHYDTCDGRLENLCRERCISYDIPEHGIYDPRSSTETYASTVPSESELEEDESEYAQPPPRPDSSRCGINPATPRDFSILFPSSTKLYIKHDDSTMDGNMNLRIDTLVKLDGGRSQELGMFHLRMHDLKKREFSFRRYSRDSGKEVCHSIQKYEKSAIERRPNLPRSISSAFASFLPRSSTTSSLKRSDSGNSSVYSPTSTDFDEQRKGQGGAGKRHASIPIPTKTTKLEFSNYAQVDIKRRGVKGSKRYEFEYWATKYVWKRVVRQTSSSEAVSYHLYHAGDEKILAQIEPTPMSGREAQEERLRGGWVPPCEMWINDNRILSDRNEEADVIVASGLMALVDDCIRRRFSPKSTRQLLVPIPKFRVDMDYTSTKHFINDVLNRQPARRPSSVYRPSPVRKASCDV